VTESLWCPVPWLVSDDKAIGDAVAAAAAAAAIQPAYVSARYADA